MAGNHDLAIVRRRPECNGVIERFMRTLKEQCLYLHRFQTLEEARAITSRSGLSRLHDRRQNDRREIPMRARLVLVLAPLAALVAAPVPAAAQPPNYSTDRSVGAKCG